MNLDEIFDYCRQKLPILLTYFLSTRLIIPKKFLKIIRLVVLAKEILPWHVNCYFKIIKKFMEVLE
ncbi:hypothetical protein THER_0797 [Thermodesulfovibrio sp. N1]|nr:hypothetical protein THER_0797 [Thermodesulfovibrio sp. N1]